MKTPNTPKLKVLSVFGTRPEAIKMAPLVKALEQDEYFTSLVAVSAQHREMLDQVLALFEIKPDFDLDIMAPSQDLFDITSKALLGLREVLTQSQPDIVLVHGDTSTCFAAALAAFYLQIPVGHVEAGLRTGDLLAPFPEEANRSLTGRLARFHFAPTEQARLNLIAEGIDDSSIWVTGNTVIDALLETRKVLHEQSPTQKTETWLKTLDQSLVQRVQNRASRLILITGHRRENFGAGFIQLCKALKTIAERNPDWLLIYPVHLNPQVQQPVRSLLSPCENIILCEPQSYLPFVWLLDQCDLVITDSGGIQEEAPALGKPVIVTREVTERPEAVTFGIVTLTGTDTQKIIRESEDILKNPERYAQMSQAKNPYGDGKAAARIVEALRNYEPAKKRS